MAPKWNEKDNYPKWQPLVYLSDKYHVMLFIASNTELCNIHNSRSKNGRLKKPPRKVSMASKRKYSGLYPGGGPATC